MIYVVIALAVFGVCFLLDKGFKKFFRNKRQHETGLSVKPAKRYAVIGILVFVLGIAAILTGINDGWILIAGGSVLILLGIALIGYYLSFGVYYDEDTFLYHNFGIKNREYRYDDIMYQQLYVSGNSTVIELHLRDGKTLQLQSGMEGVYPFMDKAFSGWLRQTGRRQEDCDFYKPENSCWFPSPEE